MHGQVFSLGAFRHLLAVFTVAVLSVLIVGCDGGLMGTETQSESPMVKTAAESSAQPAAQCENVSGTAEVTGTLGVAVTGTIEGDLNGSVTVKRTGTKKGPPGAVLVMQDWFFDTDEFGTFEGESDGRITPAENGQANVRVDLVGENNGFLFFNGHVTITTLPEIKVEADYRGRVCSAG